MHENPVPLRDPLPNFFVPLQPGDQDVLLRLQEAFDENNRPGRYSARADCTKPSSPKLPTDDTARIDDLLVERDCGKSIHLLPKPFVQPVKLFPALLFYLVICSSRADYSLRTWAVGERSVEARLLRLDDQTAHLENTNGVKTAFSIRQLGEKDRAYLLSVKKAMHVAGFVRSENTERRQKALDTLREMGEAGREELERVCFAWFRETGTAIQEFEAETGKAPRQLCKDIVELQKAARKAIPKLEKGEKTVEAEARWKQLTTFYGEFVNAFTGRQPLLDHRRTLAGIAGIMQKDLPDTWTKAEAHFDSLREKIDQQLNMESEDVDLLQKKVVGGRPVDPVAELAWLYGNSRRIEAFNEAQSEGHSMTGAELAVAQQLNRYREAIGLLPYEFDRRIANSSREHSKEMKVKNYFSHTSPTSGKKSFVDRAKLQGYEHPGGENIALGPQDPEKVFMMWFHSPPHHQNMASAGFSEVGVGQHDNIFTMVFGRESREALR